MDLQKHINIDRFLVEFTVQLHQEEGVIYHGVHTKNNPKNGEILRYNFEWNGEEHKADLDLVEGVFLVDYGAAYIQVDIDEEGYKVGGEGDVISSGEEAAEKVLKIMRASIA